MEDVEQIMSMSSVSPGLERLQITCSHFAYADEPAGRGEDLGVAHGSTSDGEKWFDGNILQGVKKHELQGIPTGMSHLMYADWCMLLHQ